MASLKLIVPFRNSIFIFFKLEFPIRLDLCFIWLNEHKVKCNLHSCCRYILPIKFAIIINCPSFLHWCRFVDISEAIRKLWETFVGTVLLAISKIASPNKKSSAIRKKGEFHNGRYKKTKHARFVEKRTFLTPWYPYTRPFALLPKCLILEATVEIDSPVKQLWHQFCYFVTSQLPSLVKL